MTLTGRFNFRRSMLGRLLLEVEEEVKPFFAGDKKPLKRRWRRATLMDLAQPEMRALIDLRFQPQFISRSSRPVDLASGATNRPDDLPPAVAMLPRADGVPQRTSH